MDAVYETWSNFAIFHKKNLETYGYIRQYPYNSLTFARHNMLADNFS